MRKLATLSLAVLATFAIAGAASALRTAAITGSNLPGVNTYTITMTFDEPNIQGIVTGVNTTGIYTGVFTDTPPPQFPTNLAGPAACVGTGICQYWGAVTGAGPQPAGTYTLGTVQITVLPGDVINPHFGSLAGFVTSTSFTTVGPNAPLSGVTIIPEPTTAALLGFGIVGLVLAGRRNRA